MEWYGNGGEDVFFQNENPYDPPSQAAWMDGSQDGYPAFEVEPGVTTFNGYGMGSYSYFNEGGDRERRSLRSPNDLGGGVQRHPHGVP